MTSSMAARRVWKRRPCRRATFNDPHRLSVTALTLLCQARRAESFKSAKMSGYSSRTM